MGGLDLVDQPVHGLGLGVHARPTVGLGPRVHEVAVVVPLDVADVVLSEHREDRVADERVALGDAEVDDLLVPRLERQAATGRHHPLGVRAGDVGVDVHHLRLEPEAELHAEPRDVVDQGVEAVRPDVRRDRPVAEARVVVAPRPEPAVVEHVPLDPQRRRDVGEVAQRRQVVVEVDGLPDVQRDGAVVRRMLGAGPQERVEPAGALVEPATVGAVQPRRRVRLTRRELHLAGEQQLSPTDDLLAGPQPLCVVGVVAAPPDVDAPGLAVAEAGPRRQRMEDRGRVRTCTTLAALTQMRTHRKVSPLGDALQGPAAREVEQLPGDSWHRVGEDQVLQEVRIRRAVGDARAAAQQPAGRDLELEGQLEPRNAVGGDHDEPRPG